MNFVRTAVLLALATTLVGCADTPLLSGKKAPDELAVIEGPPLYLPPSFDVRPPSEMNPTLAKEASTEEKAQEIITGNKSTPAMTGGDDADWLVKRAGGDSRDATIRTRLETEEKARQEVKKEKDNRGFFSRVFGGNDDAEPKVDEAGRVILDQNAPDAGSYQKQ